MHSCRKSCFKYNPVGTPKHLLKCRYNYPRDISQNTCEPSIIHSRDRKNRTQIKIQPSRNNANINVHAKSPLFLLGLRGNHDLQFLDNSHGGVEYACKYASKADAADFQIMKNAFTRILSKYIQNMTDGQDIPLKNKLSLLGQTFLIGDQIGSVHAVYILGRLPLIKSSRTVININSDQIISKSIITDPIILETMGEDEDAYNSSPTSAIGKRLAFLELVKEQRKLYNTIDIDYYTFNTYFNITKPTQSHYKKYDERVKTTNYKIPLLQLNNEGKMLYKNNDDKSENVSYCTNLTFIINNVYYYPRRKPAVLAICPYRPVDEYNEKSAYSILLLHSKWGDANKWGDDQNFANILGDSKTAVDRLQLIRNTLPTYVLPTLNRRKISDNMQNETGTPALQEQLEQLEADEIDELLQNAMGETEQHQAIQYANDYQHVTQVEPTNINPNEKAYIYNASIFHKSFLANYIENAKNKLDIESQSIYKLTPNELFDIVEGRKNKIDVSNKNKIEEQLKQRTNRMNTLQLKAYNTIKNTIESDSDHQVIMFLTGEGGTGKSEVIHAIKEYVLLTLGKTKGILGPVIVCAPTGNAAFNIGGSTYHKVFSKNEFESKSLITVKDIPQKLVHTLQTKGDGCKVLIIDEISLISLEQLYEIDIRCRVMTGATKKPFGGLHVVLAGDMYQMKTVGGTSIVEEKINRNNIAALKGKEIFNIYLTDYVCLEENCRAKSTNGELSPMAKFCKAARKAQLDNLLITIINSRVVNTEDLAMQTAHPKAVWITSTHEKISAINSKCMQKLQQQGNKLTRIIATHKPKDSTIPYPNETERNECYSVHGDFKGKRNNPMMTQIDLCIGARVRLLDNLCVEMGLYNGAMGTVRGFVFQGPEPQNNDIPTKDFYKLPDDKREIPIVLVEMDGQINYSVSKNIKNLIPFYAKAGQCTIKNKYIRYQLPLLPAFARTTHSVQGVTAHNGVVIDPGTIFFAGDYVAISRATDINLLIMLKPVTHKNFASHPDFRNKINNFYNNLNTRFNIEIV